MPLSPRHGPQEPRRLPHTAARRTGGPTCFADLYSVFALSADDIWAVGEAGEAYHYQGGAWQMLHVHALVLHGLAMVSANEGWAVGNGGFILHYATEPTTYRVWLPLVQR